MLPHSATLLGAVNSDLPWPLSRIAGRLRPHSLSDERFDAGSALGHQERFRSPRLSGCGSQSGPLLPKNQAVQTFGSRTQPRAVLCAAEYDEGVYRLHSLT